ncbi:hypothetical protein APHAL10511_004551 [Amanita phalloides]|nr:hypothetical protein APHAL10511_004551 [Amanita phalloides]
MFSYVLSTATAYFYLPIDEEEDADIAKYERKSLTWMPQQPRSSSPARTTHTSANNSHDEQRTAVLNEILACKDLYDVLGVPKLATDRMMLRRAYLSRTKACHPDKFPDNPDATHAFQKVALAYDVLSKPTSKRLYDNRPSSSNYDAYTASQAEETLRDVVLGAFNDFLDGDLEIARTLLKGIHDVNPSLRLGDGGTSSILEALQTIRERALTCRTCIVALHAEVTRLFEIKTAFQRLSYLDVIGHSRLTIQLTRVTITIPIALENALRNPENRRNANSNQATFLPRHVRILIHAVDTVLSRMEKMLP